MFVVQTKTAVDVTRNVTDADPALSFNFRGISMDYNLPLKFS